MCKRILVETHIQTLNVRQWCLCQWIGLVGEIYRKPMVFTIKYRGSRLKFSHHPILCLWCFWWFSASGSQQSIWAMHHWRNRALALCRFQGELWWTDTHSLLPLIWWPANGMACTHTHTIYIILYILYIYYNIYIYI